MRLEQKIASHFIHRKMTLAVAESCTGGLLAHRLTNIAGSSAFFWLGIIAYDNAAKIRLLKIPAALLKNHGAISAPVAQKMAQNVRTILKTDWGIGITGIAGPGGGSKTKPVGLTYIALSNGKTTLAHQFQFKSSRLGNKNHAVQAAMKILLMEILRSPK